MSWDIYILFAFFYFVWLIFTVDYISRVQFKSVVCGGALDFLGTGDTCGGRDSQNVLEQQGRGSIAKRQMEEREIDTGCINCVTINTEHAPPQGRTYPMVSQTTEP